jgi:hypothetical protein
VLSEFLYNSSSHDGKANISSGGAHRMRESFRKHFNALAFGIHDENTAAGTMTANAETGTVTAKKETKSNAETGSPTAKNDRTTERQ